MDSTDPVSDPIDPAELVRAFEQLTPEQRLRVRAVLAESYGRSHSELRRPAIPRGGNSQK